MSNLGTLIIGCTAAALIGWSIMDAVAVAFAPIVITLARVGGV